MKFKNKLQEDIFNYFNTRNDFHFHGYTGTFFFNSWEKGGEKYQLKSLRPHGNCTSISTSVRIYANDYSEFDKYGVEIAIEMYLWSYQTEEIVFQGWVESIEQLETICTCVGL